MERRYSDDAIEALFTYHPPTPEQRLAYGKINEAAMQLAKVINDNVPECPDKSAAIRLVREARMTANAAVACEPGQETPHDWQMRNELGYRR